METEYAHREVGWDDEIIIEKPGQSIEKKAARPHRISEREEKLLYKVDEDQKYSQPRTGVPDWYASDNTPMILPLKNDRNSRHKLEKFYWKM